MSFSTVIFLLSALSLTSALRDKDGRAFNFGPGPAALPIEVLRRAQESLIDYKGTGIGIMEYTNLDRTSGTHPGVPVTPAQQMMFDTEQKLRQTLDIPPDYHVLFAHGGAVGQFSAVPMNLLGKEGSCADYVTQHFWGSKALTEAQKYGDCQSILANSAKDGPVSWGAFEAHSRPCAAYLHVVMSETIQGSELHMDPPTTYGGPPVVVDATSTLLSRPINVSAYGLIYASGGKNIPHGVTVIIVRKGLLRNTLKQSITPVLFDYRINAGALEPVASIFESRPNTPPLWPIYVLSEVLDHIESEGGLRAQAVRTLHRAAQLYAIIDSSNGLYINTVHKSARSNMNVVFNLPTKELEEQFIAEAEEIGLTYIWGHPSQGGLRITTYNWITDEAIDVVASFMTRFLKANSGHEMISMEL